MNTINNQTGDFMFNTLNIFAIPRYTIMYISILIINMVIFLLENSNLLFGYFKSKKFF